MRTRAVVVACRPGERGVDGVRSCPELREGTCTSSSSRHVKEGNTKEEAFTDVSMLSRLTSGRRSTPIEALADLVTQHGESSSFPFHVQRLNPPQASSRASQPILDEGAAGNGQEA
jgi:hypothetical protein